MSLPHAGAVSLPMASEGDTILPDRRKPSGPSDENSPFVVAVDSETVVFLKSWQDAFTSTLFAMVNWIHACPPSMLVPSQVPLRSNDCCGAYSYR